MTPISVSGPGIFPEDPSRPWPPCQEMDQCKPGDHRWELTIDEGMAQVSCARCGGPLTDETTEVYLDPIPVTPAYVRDCRCCYPCDHDGWWVLQLDPDLRP